MKFKLCGKEYPYKMTLKAMKLFKDETGQDLWCSLLKVMRAYLNSMEKGASVLDTSIAIQEEVDALTAANILYSLAKQEDKCVELAEIEDAVARIGWMPFSGEGGEYTQPFTLILFSVAQSIDKQMREIHIKKK